MPLVKERTDYYTIFTINLIACLVILLSEFYFFSALPRVPDIAAIITAAYKSWTVLISMVAALWFTQGMIFKLPTKPNIVITVCHALIMFTHLLVVAWDTCKFCFRIQ